MKLIKILLIFFLMSFFLNNCSKKEKVSLVEEKDAELQMIDAFKEGYEEFNSNYDKNNNNGHVMIQQYKHKTYNDSNNNNIDNDDDDDMMIVIII